MRSETVLKLFGIFGGIYYCSQPFYQLLSSGFQKPFIELAINLLLFTAFILISILWSKRKLSSLKASFETLELSSEELKFLDFVFKGPNHFFYVNKKASGKDYALANDLINRGYLEYASYNGSEAVCLSEKSNCLFKNNYYVVIVSVPQTIDCRKFFSLSDADVFLFSRMNELEQQGVNAKMDVILYPSRKLVKVFALQSNNINLES